MSKWLGRGILLGWLSVTGMSALALGEGFYTGLELAHSSSSYNANKVKVNIPALGLADVPLNTALSNLNLIFAGVPSSGDTSVNNSGFGGRLYLGNKFSKMFAVVAGYTRYADAVIKNVFQISSSEPTQFGINQIGGTNTRVEQQSLDLSGKLFVPILDLFEIYGMLGLAYLDTFLPVKATVTTTPNQGAPGAVNQIKINRNHQTNYDMMYGFGAGYSFDDSFIVGLSYQQAQPQSKGIKSSSLVSLDLVFSFG